MKNKKSLLLVVLILGFSLATRVWRLSDPPTYVFDEVYHAFTAKYYAVNDPKGYEWWHQSPEEGTAFEWLHPPVAKLLQGLSIYLLGINSFAWRFPSVIFGVMTIGAVYWVAREITEDEVVAILASGIACMDGLLLAQSRIAMNDIFVTFFMLMAIGGYWKWKRQERNKLFGNWWLLFSSLMTGLAVSTKWSGVFVILVVGAWELIELWQSFMEKKRSGWTRLVGMIKIPLLRLVQTREGWKEWLRRWIKLGVAYVVIPSLIYILSYGQFWSQGHSVGQFVELHRQIWWYQTNLEATHPAQSRPWQWVLNLKPVWQHVNYEIPGKVGNIYAYGNPVVAWVGLMGMIWVLWTGIKKRNKAGWFLVISYLSVWLPWVISPRIMFYYHYTPAIPFLAIALAWWISGLWQKGNQGKTAIIVILGLMLIAFVWWFPYWTGLPVPNGWTKYQAVLYDLVQMKQVLGM